MFIDKTPNIVSDGFIKRYDNYLTDMIQATKISQLEDANNALYIVYDKVKRTSFVINAEQFYKYTRGGRYKVTRIK